MYIHFQSFKKKSKPNQNADQGKKKKCLPVQSMLISYIKPPILKNQSPQSARKKHKEKILWRKSVQQQEISTTNTDHNFL